MTRELLGESAVSIAARIMDGEMSAVEVAETCLRMIDEENPRLNAFTVVTYDIALEAARRCDESQHNGEPCGPLHGVPVAIKDLSDVACVPTTSGSPALRDYTPSTSSVYVQRLVDAGAVIVGKTNVPELGHKGITDNFLFGSTKNPFDVSRNSGGSSGGSAAAVGAGLVPIAQASDGGGSTRIPASWCGIYGIKPSFGRIPDVVRPNAFALCSPYPCIGPVSRTVEDSALMLHIMAGPDDRDPFSLPASEQPFDRIEPSGLAGKKIGYSPDLGGLPVDPAVTKVVRDSLRGLEAAGAIVEEVAIDLPADQYELSMLWRREVGMIFYEQCVALRKKGYDLLGEYLEMKMTPELRDLILAAPDRTAWESRKDEWLRSEVYDAVEYAFNGYDFLVSPTMAVTAVENSSGQQTLGPTEINDMKVDPTIGHCLTYPFNFTGHPAASLPCGLLHGLPVGLQLVAHRYRDAELLAASAAFEKTAPWTSMYELTEARR